MRTDPIRPNFYRGTGGYAWQLAEYLQSNQADRSGNDPLDKSLPPILQNPLATCPEFLALDRSVRWSRLARITPNTPQLVGARGIRSSLVVVASAQVFGGFRHEDAQALAEGTTVGALQGMEINGVVHDAGTLLITLYRHGFVEVGQTFPACPPVSYMIEPTCIVVDAPGVGHVAVNQLNGRTVRLNETSQRIFSQDKLLNEIPESLRPNIIHFVEAGMLRLTSGGNARAYD
ncbi:hypothetical protein PHO31112_05043 [Pandoraea horticolens]|uniref:Uncharacterized protein n=1 Tax=Pandoraea horticolens TaxID=2508298 RepID=A0A5E4Z5E2_9BURK|nr:hypothetical protein [Pandoraea horticolens]VVE55948.1 hypothetical protein PHO31112_05043 [Pandoraea horticolens]